MNRFIGNIKKFYQNNKAEFYILLAILFLGAFLRLYKIESFMTFLGDEGRDVIIVRRLLVESHPPLIGPGTSIGNMYLGPFYYYMMAPALLLANFSPVGPAVQIALLGVATVWFVWYLFRQWFPVSLGGQSSKAVYRNVNWGAVISAFLYAISPTIIIYSRSSWNPNIMPFFALLSIFSVWKVYKEHKFKWLLVLGFAFAAVIQSHYLGLLLLPTLGIFWLLTLRSIWHDKKIKLTAIRYTLGAILIFIALMSPLFFFDLRHDWINSKAMYQFFTVRQTTVNIKPWKAIPAIWPQFTLINSRLAGGQNINAGLIISVIIIVAVLWSLWLYLKKSKTIQQFNNLTILMTWFLFALIGFGLYKQNIYDHYYGFIFPIPFLLLGCICSYLIKYGLKGKLLAGLIVGYLAIVSIQNTPIKASANNQLKRANDVARKIEQESGGQRFNLGVIAERNYEDGYKYFLLKDKAPVVDITSQDKNSITDQLFAVCELAKEKCDPTHNASAAVANFGWSKIEQTWEVDGVLVYKLVHSLKQ